MQNSSLVVLDFETTGLSPKQGGRAIEIGAIRVANKQVGETFQSLMNPGVPVSAFIESYTGISNKMVSAAPPCGDVMEQFFHFIGDDPLVAHNASFDTQFLDSEFWHIGRRRANPVACSMLAARRLFPQAPNHKLGTLVHYCGIEHDGVFHRALADAQMTAQLWIAMENHLETLFGIPRPPFSLLQELSKIPKSRVAAFLKAEQKKMHPSLW